jgi:acyl-CoA thioesterase
MNGSGSAHPFDRDLSLTRLAPFLYRGNVTDNWSINGIPNGGYLMALLAHAMVQESAKKDTLIITANYLHRCEIGEADLAVKNIAGSRRFDRWQAVLSQRDQERVRALGTFVRRSVGTGERRYDSSPPEMADLEACVAMPPLPRFTFFNQMDVRLDPACAGWLQGELADRLEQKGWVRFKEPRPYDMISALMIADAFPPPVLAAYGMVAWVPTIELTVNVRNLPKTPWLKCAFRTRYIDGDILEEDGEVWDGNGELVALSRQVAQFRKLQE